MCAAPTKLPREVIVVNDLVVGQLLFTYVTTGGAVVPPTILIGHPEKFVQSNALVQVLDGLRQRLEEMFANVLHVALGGVTTQSRRVKVVVVALYQVRVARRLLVWSPAAMGLILGRHSKSA